MTVSGSWRFNLAADEGGGDRLNCLISSGPKLRESIAAPSSTDTGINQVVFRSNARDPGFRSIMCRKVSQLLTELEMSKTRDSSDSKMLTSDPRSSTV